MNAGPCVPVVLKSERKYTYWRRCFAGPNSVPETFEIIGTIREVVVIAVGYRIRCMPHLVKLHGPGRWRKMKGIAPVRLPSGRVRIAEVHWYEAHGIGRVEIKRKRYLQ